MEYWEFLIQREGDRGWRSIKTGNLQLMEGNYRIVANSNLLNAPIQLRITHQLLGATIPQRRSLVRDRVSNAKGTLLIIPYTQLHSGIWQFVCTGTTTTQTTWHKVLKLRVLPRSPLDRQPGSTHPNTASAPEPDRAVSSIESPDPTHAAPVKVVTFSSVEEIESVPTPTQPVVAGSIDEMPETWAEGLDRLLAQIERESLQPQQQLATSAKSPVGIGVAAAAKATITSDDDLIQLVEIDPPPSQPIELDRTIFAGTLLGDRLAISGVCNLQLLSPDLARAVKIDRLSICLRHPQTSEQIVAIERAVPAHLSAFTFSGRVNLPSELGITLLRGEVNLYDRHNIQLGSSSFTVTVDLNPIVESDRSLLSLFDTSPITGSAHSRSFPENLRARLDRELQMETFTPQGAGADLRESHTNPPTHIPPLTPSQYPTVPLAYKREPSFKPQPEICADGGNAAAPKQPLSGRTENSHKPATSPPIELQQSDRPVVADITGDLEIGFVQSTVDISDRLQDYDTWEVVIDD
jgi:hypothetical protein